MKAAFIVQRCGKEVVGGAEFYCFMMAQHLSKFMTIEVLTTCALDYTTWADHYKPGIEEIGHFKIRRFSVPEPRQPKVFEHFCIQLDNTFRKSRGLFEKTPADEQERWMKEQGPISPDLMNFVKTHKDDYDVFVFFGYLYATTYLILPEVREKAVLLPFAHDEWPIYLTIWNDWFLKPAGFIFSTHEEKMFLQKRFPRIESKKLDGPIVGIGVTAPKNVDPERFRKKYRIKQPFMLYVGRIDILKGCSDLFHDFAKLKRSYRILPAKLFNFFRGNKAKVSWVSWKSWKNWKLIFVGKAAITLMKHPDVVELGALDEESKWDALAAAELLVLPSAFESLSIVVLEAWMAKKPVLVNGNCSVLVGQCSRSGGGLWYRTFSDFVFSLEKLIDPEVRKRLGEKGFDYVTANYSWPMIERKFLQALKPFERG